MKDLPNRIRLTKREDGYIISTVKSYDNWYGGIIAKLISKNPMIPYLIVTFIYANLVVCAVNLTVNLIKSGKRYERKNNG